MDARRLNAGNAINFWVIIKAPHRWNIISKR